MYELFNFLAYKKTCILTGISMEIYAIMDGHVLPYILDPNFEKHLPIIPSEVGNSDYGLILDSNKECHLFHIILLRAV